MGLDMWFNSFPAEATEELLNKEEDKLTEDEIKIIKSLHNSDVEIAYFRKHSDLHGWLTEKWLKRHPEDDGLNVNYMEITPELLAEMTAYANQSDHERCQGVFWGQSDDSDWERTREVCKQIKEILDEGDRKVFYYAWW